MRIPAFIVIVASLVTIVQLLMQGYVPSLYASLGIYIPLIVVNCIILGRAESYACKNGPAESFFDGLGTVSYTHLDVYKRQDPGRPVFQDAEAAGAVL